MEAIDKRILYVEDDLDDRDIFLEAIRETNPDADVVFAENGWEALRYLETVLSANEKLPCLIVLDINMPVLDGKETFYRIRKNDRLKKLPLVIFTSSENPADKALFHELGIEMITKPNNYAFMNRIARHMLSICA